MSDFLCAASILFDQFKLDNRRGRGGGDTPDNNSPSSTPRRRSGYDPSQERGRDGRWVETNAESRQQPTSNNTDKLFDEDSAIGRAYKREQEALAQKEAETTKKQIPKDVEAEDLGRGGVQYTHDTKEGNKLEVIITPVADGSTKNVDFTINGAMDKAESLATEEANRISIKIAKIMQFDASQRADGEKYVTSAYTGDSEEYAAVRTYAYERIAKFSRPVGGEPGAYQYAVVKNGKLQPDTKRVEEEEEEEQLPPVYIKENINSYIETAEEYRRSRKK